MRSGRPPGGQRALFQFQQIKLTEILTLEQAPRRLRDENLSAMRLIAEPGIAVNHLTERAVARRDNLPGVERDCDS